MFATYVFLLLFYVLSVSSVTTFILVEDAAETVCLVPMGRKVSKCRMS